MRKTNCPLCGSTEIPQLYACSDCFNILRSYEFFRELRITAYGSFDRRIGPHEVDDLLCLTALYLEEFTRPQLP